VSDVALPGVALEILEICREEAAAALNAQGPFERWAHEIGVRTCTWHVAEGPELAVMQSSAKWCDLIVLERSNEGTQESLVAALGQTVLRADLPCIIVPWGVVLPRLERIAVAWKGTVESIRALRAALPLLKRAGQTTLIYGERGQALADASSVDQARAYLEDHGIKAALKRIDPEPASAGAEILAATIETSSDMLVMGAYGRTRLSEWMFGGATRHVLELATMPVFMRH
jgi:nucleotide-binding universal stress UspA family protein